jgi:hypothetical protein
LGLEALALWEHWGKEDEHMRALLCHCHRRLEAEDNQALLKLVREHLVREHLDIPPTNTQIKELLTHAYDYECVQIPVDEELVYEPY